MNDEDWRATWKRRRDPIPSQDLRNSGQLFRTDYDKPPEKKSIVSSPSQVFGQTPKNDPSGGCEGDETIASTSGGEVRNKCEGIAKPAKDIAGDLEALLPVIQEGCRMGLAVKLDGVSGGRVARLIEGAGDSAMSADGYEATCRKAGPVTTFAALIDSYRQSLAALEAVGGDGFVWQGALTLALAHKTAREGAYGTAQ